MDVMQQVRDKTKMETAEYIVPMTVDGNDDIMPYVTTCLSNDISTNSNIQATALHRP